MNERRRFLKSWPMHGMVGSNNGKFKKPNYGLRCDIEWLRRDAQPGYSPGRPDQ